MELVPGHVLTQKLGAGGFGEVWEARKADGSRVALKFQDTRKRHSMQIQSEIRVLNGLRELCHPNIIQFHGVHANSHYLILSMERADGSLLDLRQTYQEEGMKTMPPEHALDLLEDAAQALDFLVDQKLECFNAASPGLQHCDVKPSNLLVVGDTVKVADFGLCASTSWQTHRNSWRGTLPYAAPELYRGKASVHTDQYALAVTFCELCIGERCFFPLDPTPGPPKMPIDLTKLRENEFRIVSRALAPNYTDRWPSCQEFINALRKAVQVPRSRPQIETVRHVARPKPVSQQCSGVRRAIQ
jgi:serine/threonine protein kinase